MTEPTKQRVSDEEISSYLTNEAFSINTSRVKLALDLRDARAEIKELKAESADLRGKLKKPRVSGRQLNHDIAHLVNYRIDAREEINILAGYVGDLNDARAEIKELKAEFAASQELVQRLVDDRIQRAVDEGMS